MDDWFRSIAGNTQLCPQAADALQRDGFVVLPGILPACRLAEVADAYNAAVSQALPDDIKIGSTTTRVRDFVNRGPSFDELYLCPSILQACCRVIAQPFKLSTLHARTLRPHMPAQRLHVDFASDEQGWPMLGFILMVDDFTRANGATCFLPGSQGAKTLPALQTLVPACGSAGSVIVFNGSVWHGHGENATPTPRRSIQGAYIRRTETAGDIPPLRMQHDTLARIGGLAKYLLAL